MGQLLDKLKEDIRFIEGLKACINCGTCAAICPAVEFYDYQPRYIINILQSKDDAKIEELLKSDFIWYCGECMSCKTRCPRGNVPGLIITALRSLSQDLGYFTESKKGRQQLAIKRTVGRWLLEKGYCLYAEEIDYANHPEQGPVWEWELKNLDAVMQRLGANYKGEGSGILRKIPQSALDELKKIFDVTGCTERFEKIEQYSSLKANEIGLQLDDTMNNEYIKQIYNTNNQKLHSKKV
ncbi:MAG: 4Fe-4S dicluster domain-containing protein [Bacteroidales bacterium]|nr:4Fe-4S dicluster domain-containing protein [Bacteroidales bacterium]